MVVHFKMSMHSFMLYYNFIIFFQVHRSCMVMAFLLTAAAFVVIFVHVGGYAEVSTSDLFHEHQYM